MDGAGYSMKLKVWLIVLMASLGTYFLCGTVNADAGDKVYNKTSASTYQLFAIDKDKETILALGNAVAVTKNYLATNCHVAFAGNFLIVKVNDNPYLARLCYYDHDSDLCIIDVVGVELKPATIRATKTVKVGEPVYIVGELRTTGKVMMQGTIQKILNEGSDVVLLTNAAMVPGISGSGVFDKEGNLIGIASRGAPGTDVGFAISTELITQAIDPKHLPACKLPPEKQCAT